MAKRKYYWVSFPDIQELVLEAIVYAKKNGYSEQWLRVQFKKYRGRDAA